MEMSGAFPDRTEVSARLWPNTTLTGILCKGKAHYLIGGTDLLSLYLSKSMTLSRQCALPLQSISVNVVMTFRRTPGRLRSNPSKCWQ